MKKNMLEQDNKSLLKNNSFYNLINNSNEIYFIHITKNKELIEESGYIYPSSGCLLGSVYCTPGYIEKDNYLRLHNLGKYYYDSECPKVIKDRSLKGIPHIYIIKFKANSNNLVGVNYLKFGKLHYKIYKELNYLLTEKEKEKLENIVYEDLSNSYEFIKSIDYYSKSTLIVEKRIFLNKLLNNIKYLPILGYVYFEAINKSIMIYQDDDLSKKYKSLGEFYNYNYKNMMIYFHDDFFSKFNLCTFSESLEDIIKYLKDNKIVNDTENFEIEFFNNLFSFLYDVIGCNNTLIFSNNISKRLDKINKCYYSLAGHIIHRELRNFKRYPDFYFYFDQVKALKVWNEWNRKNKLILYNSIIPKGEVGLNPAYLENIEYEIYEGINYKEIDNIGYVEIGNKTNVKIATRLVDKKYSLMRNYKVDLFDKK